MHENIRDELNISKVHVFDKKNGTKKRGELKTPLFYFPVT
jgi:hypothetical protein